MTDLRTAAQQALEALGSSLYPQPRQLAAIAALRAALAEPVQEQDVEDAIEAAYWHFDARKKGLNEWASAPQSERDAFKAEARKLAKGYFPTRQAQDTKREMLAVADAFIRGKRAALAQEQAEPFTPDAIRATQAAWKMGYEARKAEQAEPVQEPDSPERRCGGPGCDLKCCQPVEEPVAWLYEAGNDRTLHWNKPPLYGTPLYTEPAPPQREPLSGEQLRQIELGLRIYYDNDKYDLSLHDFARAIERAHGIGDSNG